MLGGMRAYKAWLARARASPGEESEAAATPPR